jgi:phage shock protein A
MGKVVANKHLASKKLMASNSKHEDLASKIELAVGEGRDDLAEAAIAQQLDLEAQMPILESTIKECGEKEVELEGFINALQAKKREMKEDLASYRASRQEAESATAGASTSSGGGSDLHGKVAQAESAFDRVMEKQTGIAGAGSDLANSGKLAELDDLARKNRIQERLAAAKAQSD